jgi:activator of HSP90 ATPase
MVHCGQMDKKLTRRQMSLVLGALGAASAHAQTNRTGAGKTSIHQTIDFKATPARIYEVLLDAKQFSAFTKDTAEVQPQPGAAFRLFGGRIEGRNIELIPNQRIVQAWRPASWAAGVYSIVRFELVAAGLGARLVLDHAGFTEDKWEGLNDGWPKMYWEPLHKYLNA